ncbi:MAG TPA: hypothetical protein VFG76_06845 [Candidatus Polarisedimenticolia bacterium]|nr:hypothetical protein [Candidatus Polarisedimenticolia bacterium]
MLVRITPKDGPVETINLSTGFLDGGSSRSVLTRAEPTYREELEDREDINRASRPLLLGFRPEVALEFQVTKFSAHHPTIAKIQNRLMSSYYRVELSLDNGTTYREVVLKRAASPRAFSGKTVAGAKLELIVETRELISTYPDIGAGTSW